MAFRTAGKGSEWRPNTKGNAGIESKQGEDDDDSDAQSVVSVDVSSYQRQPAYHQPNRFQNIRHKSHYLQSRAGHNILVGMETKQSQL